MRFRAVKQLLCLSLLGLAGMVGAQDRKEVPKVKGLVNDFAGVLSAEQVQGIEGVLRRYEDSTTTQIAVVLETSFGQSNEYDRAMDFARGWGVGSKENNNGVLLYIAVNDHRYQTLTSQKTQGKLTDGVVGDIERNYLVPNFKKTPPDYYHGILGTVTQYMLALNGEFKAGKRRSGDQIPGWVVMLIIFGIIFLIGLLNNSGRGGRGITRSGGFWFPGTWGGNSGGWGGGSSGGGGGWGGFGGGGGFDGGGAGGGW